jgi:phosphoglycolate phosphatase
MIVFDLDGTLIDSSRDLAEAASELVQGYGAPPWPLPTWSGWWVRVPGSSWQRALAHVGLDPDTPGALERFLAIYDRRLLDHTVPYEGMHEVLAMLLRAGPLAVLTNKPGAPRADPRPARFARVLLGRAGRRRRPSAEARPVRTSRADAASSSGLTMMVGDSPASMPRPRRRGVSRSCWRTTASAPRSSMATCPPGRVARITRANWCRWPRP